MKEVEGGRQNSGAEPTNLPHPKGDSKQVWNKANPGTRQLPPGVILAKEFPPLCYHILYFFKGILH